VLADSAERDISAAGLRPDLHVPSTFREKLIEFIRAELVTWRDRHDRPAATGETRLNSQLCVHLNGASRHSVAWSSLQFLAEPPDEVAGTRNLDLQASPCGTAIWIEGRRHTEFDSILPMECKRLPTPPSASRDEREYLFSSYACAGGVQRFKEGVHASKHAVCAIIGYLQADDAPTWRTRINRWVEQLAASKESGWSASDMLELSEYDAAAGAASLQSHHKRVLGLPDVDIRHLWIEIGRGSRSLN